MTLTSYAQRGEDLKLWSFFEGKTDGHYIDIGANDPVIDSVSKSFYDVGWRGINVEPLSNLAHDLDIAQPESTTICCGISDKQEIGVLHFDPQRSGLSTLDCDLGVKEHLRQSMKIPLTTLVDLCDKYVSWPIDWLKIDVEGWETQVIRGGDWDRFRPSIVVVEATVPMTDIPAWGEWEPLLLDVGYEFLDFEDGLNRFYRDGQSR
jgi:FkbM family methyltransferase